MKIFNKKSIIIASAVFFVFGIVSPIASFAATTPSLGAADTFGILAGTYTNTTVTTINGDVGYTTGPATAPTMSGGTIYGAGAPTPTARTDAATALTNLDSQGCTFTFAAGAINLATDTTHGTIGVYTPGVYCTSGAGAASIGTGGITLSGSGTFIFRVNGALTSVDNSVVTLSNGAASCDVFWTPTAATTLGANTTFVGTIIDNANAITLGANTRVTGRLLSLGAGVVTTDTNTITRACSTAAVTGTSRAIATINVVKTVINDNGGTKTVADFPLFVNGMPVVSGVTNNFAAPAAAFTITETSNSNYTQTFSGDCDINGQVNLNPGDNRFCIITNNDIGASVAVAPVPPLIDVVKVPSPLALPSGPGLVNYTYTLHNIGTVPVTNITMAGDTCSPIVMVSGDTNNDGKLDVNEIWVHTCGTMLSETHTNTVVTTGWANGISAVDITSATVVVGTPINPPLIHVTKIPSPLALSAGGGIITYTERVTNPGAVALSNVLINDDKCSPVTYLSGDTNNDSKLDPSEAWIYTCQTNLMQTTTNTAVVTGEANNMSARDFAIATVVVAVPGLPNTGLEPSENIIAWGVTLALLFSVLAAVYLERRKQTVA